MRLKRVAKRLYVSVFTGVALALATTPVLAADAAAQRSLIVELLPLFIGIGIPVGVFIARRNAADTIKGIVVGVMAFVIASAMVGTL